MHCPACDNILTPSEDASRFVGSGTRVGLCTRCRVDLPKDLDIVRVDGTKEVDGELDDNLLPWEEEGSLAEEYIGVDEVLYDDWEPEDGWDEQQ
jgi:hypothetical protein